MSSKRSEIESLHDNPWLSFEEKHLNKLSIDCCEEYDEMDCRMGWMRMN